MSAREMTSSQRHQEVRAFLRTLGYEDNQWAESYAFLGAGTENVIDFAAFAREPLDMSNAVLVGQADPVRGDALGLAFEAATSLACPAVLVADEIELAVYSLKDRLLIDRIRYGERPSDAILRSLQSDALLQSKLQHPQLSLFEVDVNELTNARRRATTLLRDRVVNARDLLREAAHIRDYRLDSTSIAALLVDALTCLFIEDKFQVEYGSSEWLQEVHTRFGHLSDDLEAYDDTMQALLDYTHGVLREGINYRSLDSVVIADLYEPRLVDPGASNENGIVYTPYELAARIMDRVPIEMIAPEDRTVLDFACGSGTLLLAAHERLREAHPDRLRPSQMHDYLVNALEGWDRDPFAVQLTHLSLTLKGHPLGNGWRVEEVDTLRSAPVQKTIVIANPPWGGRRTGGPTNYSDRSRDDAVSPFISWAMNSTSPGGLLAMFLPASWLTARHSEGSRRLLGQSFDLLEVWRLPEETFRGADVKGAVFIARRRVAAENVRPLHYLSHYIPNETALAQFMQDGASPQTSLTNRPIAGESIGVSSILTPYIEARGEQRIGDVFSLRTGPPRGAGPPGGVLYRWLGDVKQMHHFGKVTAANTRPAMYPHDFDRKAGWDPSVHYDSKKLLVTRVRRSDNPWRVKVGFAYESVIPSNNQYALTVLSGVPLPNNDDAYYAAGAILGSGPIAAWVDDLTTTGNIRRETFSRIRLPDGWLNLASAGRVLADLASDPRSEGVYRTAAIETDARVAALYGIPDDVWERARVRFEGERAPEGSVRYEISSAHYSVPELDEQTQWRDGVVLGTDDAGVQLWVDGYTPDSGFEVPVPPRLPASTFLPGVTFMASRVGTDPLGGFFRLHKSNFESLDEFHQDF